MHTASFMLFSPASIMVFAIKKLLCGIFEAIFISFYAGFFLLTIVFVCYSDEIRFSHADSVFAAMKILFVKHGIHPSVKCIYMVKIFRVNGVYRVRSGAETPVFIRNAGNIHSGVAAETAHILKRDDRNV